MDKRLSILSDLEKFAFYGFPDFTDEQRTTYFDFEEQEWNLISTCPSLHTQVYWALQIGYFKAKKLFFPLYKIPQVDVHFILARYFQIQILQNVMISKYEYYLQRELICHLFGYKLWFHEFLPQLHNRAHFASQNPDNPLLKAIHWLQRIFAKHSPLSRQRHFPTAFISKRLSPYLFTLNEKGEQVVRVNRYEILVYAQIAKKMETGSIYVTNSIRYRPFSHDLVFLDEKATILKALDIPWLRTPREKQLDLLTDRKATGSTSGPSRLGL